MLGATFFNDALALPFSLVFLIHALRKLIFTERDIIIGCFYNRVQTLPPGPSQKISYPEMTEFVVLLLRPLFN